MKQAIRSAARFAIASLRSRFIRIVCLAGALACAEGASAFADPSVPLPPHYSSIDERGVDLVSGIFYVSGPSISVGQLGAGGLRYTATYNTQQTTNGTAWTDNFISGINSTGAVFTVTVMGATERFGYDGTNYTSSYLRGGALTFNGGTNKYTYTMRDGSVAVFDKSLAGSTPYQANEGLLISVTRPSGEIITFSHKTFAGGSHRLQSVNNNFGYQIRYEYATATALYPSDVKAINNGVDYCDTTSDACGSLPNAWPTIAFGAGGATPASITDAAGKTTAYTYGAAGVATITWPGSASANVTIGYDGGKRVTSICYFASGSCDAAHQWAYSYSVTGAIATTLSTGPDSFSRSVESVIYNLWVIGDTDALGRKTTFNYDGSGRLDTIIPPEGTGSSGYTHYVYDGRSNITQVTRISKTPGTPANIVTSAAYDTTCSNFATCNQPNSTTDARGNVTNYTYYTHGGVHTVTPPAVGGVSPTVTYTYQTQYAWYRTSSSTTMVQGGGITVLTQVSQCQTTASCSGGLDEVRAAITREAGSSSVRSNLLPVSVAKGAGNLSLTATTASAYDIYGNVTSVDGPLSGADDTTTYRYDAARRQIGIIRPDPDAAGSLQRPATRIAYSDYGAVNSVRNGVVSSTSANLDTMTALNEVTTAYDAQTGWANEQDNFVDGVKQAVSQISYYNSGLTKCTVQRLILTSIPSDACTIQSTGTSPNIVYDRAQYNTYDANGRVLTTQAGYGAPGAGTVMTAAYTPNGMLDYVEDGNGNRTDYTYDGFDRVSQVNYPIAAIAGHLANSGDYESYVYDAASNITSARLRSADTIGFTYDALGRLTAKDIPGGTASDVYYGYDLLNRPTYARFVSAGGTGVEYTYDALSRRLTEKDTTASPNRTLTSTYDIAGRRTQLSYPDGNSVTYSYDWLNRMLLVKENGATTLATYAYGADVRLSSISRGNGTATTASYTSGSQNWSLSQNLASTGQDVTLSFTANAAGQTLTRSSSNASYNYAPPTPGPISYARNGLNEITGVGGTTYASDARGNLTSDGSRTFGYDVENHLTSVSGSVSATLSYDPLGRLRQVVSGGVTRQMLYDGGNLVMEYDGANTIKRRYVFGQSVDEPLVWYEGAGLSTRNYIHTDEQGTVIATSDGSGAGTLYSYDAWGRPSGDSWTGSRFRYTGQAAINEIGLYYYKARIYDPVTGRFLQTDPVGYADGPNWYAYVHNDPVNGRDPLGLCWTSVEEAAWYIGDSGDDGNGHYVPAHILWETSFIETPCDAGYSPIGSGPGINAGFGAGSGGGPQLIATTIAGDPSTCPWRVSWDLSEASAKGGIILQHVIMTYTSPSGVVTQWNYWEGGGYHYWTVDPGNWSTNYRLLHGMMYDDTFNAPAGVLTVDARAAFFEGGSLPSEFTEAVGGGPWQGLPHSETTPTLPAGQSRTVDRHLSCTVP